MTEDQKFVIVASNYRIGPLGFMSSEEEPTLTPNAGLYDGLAGLEWTRENIYRFGGDKDNVTAMGQSAGSGIIEHLLAAASEGYSIPFSQVRYFDFGSCYLETDLTGNLIVTSISTTLQ